MDSCGKIYIAKVLREAGIVGTVEIVPNNNAAVIFGVGTKLEDVLESIRIIALDLEHELKIQRRKE